MKKEVVFAIILGILLGFVVTFGIWKAKQALNTLPATTPTPTAAPTGSLEGVKETLSLSLIQPKDNDLFKTDKITVSGQTVSNATVTIIYEDGQAVTQSDEKGNFSQEITLIGGANSIKVTVFDENGNENSQEVTVVYTTADI